jgi:hypothetical protein
MQARGVAISSPRTNKSCSSDAGLSVLFNQNPGTEEAFRWLFLIRSCLHIYAHNA